MVREFIRLIDVYTAPNKEGKQKLIKKDVESRLLINLADIRYVENFITSKGRILKSKCFIKTVDNENICLKHNYEEIKRMVFIKEIDQPIGFKYKNRRL